MAKILQKMAKILQKMRFVYTFEDYHWSVREHRRMTLQSLSPNQDLSPMLG